MSKDSYKIIRYRFTAWGGRDVWRSFFPYRWQARWAAKKLTRKGGPYETWDFRTTPLVIDLADGPYRVLDKRGNVERFEGPPSPMAGI